MQIFFSGNSCDVTTDSAVGAFVSVVASNENHG